MCVCVCVCVCVLYFTSCLLFLSLPLGADEMIFNLFFPPCREALGAAGKATECAARYPLQRADMAAARSMAACQTESGFCEYAC